MQFDLLIFNAINGLVGRWAWFDVVGVFFAEYAGYFLIAILIVFIFINFKKHLEIVLETLIIAIVVRFVVVGIIHWLWFRARPFVDHNVYLLLHDYNPKEASFPSGHASFYFALSTIIYLYNKKLGIFFYIVSAFIALSRVFVGVHWPSDILIGALLGIGMGLVLNKIFKRVKIPSHV